MSIINIHVNVPVGGHVPSLTETSSIAISPL